jgi:hypothetical protein
MECSTAWAGESCASGLTSPCPRRGRRKPLEKRCRRVRCSASRRTNTDSSNRNSETLDRRQTQHHYLTCRDRQISAAATANVAPLPRSPSAHADLSSDKERLGFGRRRCAGAARTAEPSPTGRVASGRLSRKVTGEVRIGRRFLTKNLGAKWRTRHLALLFTGCRGHPCRRKFETHRGFHVK